MSKNQLPTQPYLGLGEIRPLSVYRPPLTTINPMDRVSNTSFGIIYNIFNQCVDHRITLPYFFFLFNHEDFPILQKACGPPSPFTRNCHQLNEPFFLVIIFFIVHTKTSDFGAGPKQHMPRHPPTTNKSFTLFYDFTGNGSSLNFYVLKSKATILWHTSQ